MTIIVTENPRTGTSGSPSLSAVTQHPGRVLSDLPLGAEDRLGLDRLVPVLSYTWFSEALYRQAREWAAAILRLSRTHHLTAYGPAGQTVQWLVAALCDLQRKDVDLFHRDRAEQAARVILGRQLPRRRDEIPQLRWQNGREYVLRRNRRHWSAATPVTATNQLVALSLDAMPDAWELATYVEQRQRTTYDPIIYARYGDWYIEVAEWD